jgi:hypothetical protein
MGRPAEWMQGLTGRASMRSPGKPSLRRDVERQFWCEIAKGLTSGHRSRSGGRAAGQAAQDRKAGEERSATGVCARPVVRPAPPARRDTGRGSGDGAVEGPDLLA